MLWQRRGNMWHGCADGGTAANSLYTVHTAVLSLQMRMRRERTVLLTMPLQFSVEMLRHNGVFGRPPCSFSEFPLFGLFPMSVSLV